MFFLNIFCFLIEFVTCYQVFLNSNRGFLFDNVLEPLCSTNFSGNLTQAEIVQLYHAWESFSLTQLGSDVSIENQRAAMPCFPGPDLNLTDPSLESLSPLPSCSELILKYSTAIDETQDFLDQMTQIDGVTKNSDNYPVLASLRDRLQNLKDVVPAGNSVVKIENLIRNLAAINESATWVTNSSFFSPADNLTDQLIEILIPDVIKCLGLDIGSLQSINTSSTIGSYICSTFSICSFSNLTSNNCLKNLNVSESTYDTFKDLEIQDLPKPKFDIFPIPALPLQNSSQLNSTLSLIPSVIKCLGLQITSLMSINTSSTIGSYICSKFSICSYSNVTSNSCLQKLSLSEGSYNSLKDQKIGQIISSLTSSSAIGGLGKLLSG